MAALAVTHATSCRVIDGYAIESWSVDDETNLVTAAAGSWAKLVNTRTCDLHIREANTRLYVYIPYAYMYSGYVIYNLHAFFASYSV